MRTIAITGATGVMGCETLKLLASKPSEYKIRVLARPSSKNRRLLHPFVKKGIEGVWGNLCSAEDCRGLVDGADVVLHIGGMVSPAADWFPRKTLEVNTQSIKNLIEGIKSTGGTLTTRLVYIGSVAQYGNYLPPAHWGGAGDPLVPSKFDVYAYSKVLAERELALSGLRYWVSLRQTGILHAGLLNKASDPISFHVPLEGVLEWVTPEDSARLMEGVCHEDVPEYFWRRFYNIGGGTSYRLTNYQFIKRILSSIGAPVPEKVFEPSWFATRNFHGMWYNDSDRLEEIIPFRSGVNVDEYFEIMSKRAPWWISMARIIPGGMMKAVMKKVAKTPKLGTLWWIRNNDLPRIEAAFGSPDIQQAIGDWNAHEWRLNNPPAPDKVEKYPSGYSFDPEIDTFTPDRLKELAAMHGGEVIMPSDSVSIDANSEVVFICNNGHRFSATPRMVAAGGHWCPECLETAVDPQYAFSTLENK